MLQRQNGCLSQTPIVIMNQATFRHVETSETSVPDKLKITYRGQINLLKIKNLVDMDDEVSIKSTSLVVVHLTEYSSADTL